MARLGGLASLFGQRLSNGNTGVLGDLAFVIEVDGAWVSADDSLTLSSFGYSGTQDSDLITEYTGTITYQNTSGSTVSITRAAIILTQDIAASLVSLNNDEVNFPYFIFPPGTLGVSSVDLPDNETIEWSSISVYFEE